MKIFGGRRETRRHSQTPTKNGSPSHFPHTFLPDSPDPTTPAGVIDGGRGKVMFNVWRTIDASEVPLLSNDSLREHCLGNLHEAGDVGTFDIVDIAVGLFAILYALGVDA